MPTRFYFQASGTAAASPTADATWEQTAAMVRIPMPRKLTLSAVTALTSSAAITVPITTTQQIVAWQGVSDDVFSPVRITAQDLFSLVIRCSENATTNNCFLAYVLRAMTPDGGTILGTLATSMTNTGTEFALTASQATRIFGNGTTTVALTATTIGQPWRLVLEIGAHAQAPTAAGSFIQRVGCDATSDFALTSALTTDLNPWCELSCNLNATGFNNYQHVRAGSGMSVTEKTR